MSDLIELVCECGKVLRVPKSRAGQTGKCAKCKRAVVIPMDAAQIITTSSPAAATVPLSPVAKKNLNAQVESLSKTVVRMAPLSPEQEITSTPESESQDTYESFQGNAANSFSAPAEMNAFSYDDAQADNLATAPVQQGKQCNRCGNMNRMEADQCEYCREPFETEIVSSARSEPEIRPAIKDTARRDNKSKKGSTRLVKKSSASYGLAVASLLAGILLGILVGPGYLQLVPDKDTIFSLFARNPEEPLPQIDNNPVVSNPSQPKDPKKPDEIQMPIDNPKPNSKENYDRKLKSEVDELVSHVDIYLFALNQHSQGLRETLENIKREFPNKTDLSEGYKLVDNADKWERALKQRIEYARKVYRAEEWQSLEKAHKYLKEAEAKNLNPDTNAMIVHLRSASQKAAEDLAVLRRNVAVSTPVVGSEYLGSWYSDIKPDLIKLQETCELNLNFQTTGAAIKMDTVKVNAKKILAYAKDVNNTVQELQKAMTEKNIQDWLQWRRSSANSSSQTQQADLIEGFVKTKKIPIDVASDIQQLRRGIVLLNREVNKGQQISEEVVRQVLSALQAIGRKYDEVFQNFNSAVTNFQFWNH